MKAGASFLCYVTPKEHLGPPELEDVRQGIIASKIAAHAAGIARGRTGSAGRDLAMSKARYAFGRNEQFATPLAPKRARCMHSEGLPKKAGDKKFCAMCGPDFCSMRVSRTLGRAEHAGRARRVAGAAAGGGGADRRGKKIQKDKKMTATAELPLEGKINPAIFDGLIYPRLGAPSKDLLEGPMHGLDCGVIRVAPGRVMAMTTDPFFIVPDYGWKKAAWFAFHILASDITTTGLKPSHLAVDLNLPLSIKKEELELMRETVHRECVKYGVSIVTGHTARYAGCNYPMVGGAVMTALGDEDKYVSTRMARPGDVVIVTKGAAIETCGLLAAACPELIRAELGAETLAEAEKFFCRISTVEDALAALRICAHFGIDPYASISEGTLIITASPKGAPGVLARLKGERIAASVIGEVTAGSGITLAEGGRERALAHPVTDPFWAAFAAAMKKTAAA